MGGRQASGCARTRSSCRRAWTPTRRRARPSSRSSTTPRSSRGSRSTRRSSTCAGMRAHRGHAGGDRRAAAAAVREEVGLPITVGRRAHEVPRQGGERGGEARRAARGAAGRRARVPAPAARRAAVGRRAGHGGEAPRAGIKTVARSRGSGDGARVAARPGVRPPPPRARPQPRSAAGAVGRRRRSIGGTARARTAAPHPPEIDAMLVGLVDRLGRRLRAAHASAGRWSLRLRFDDFSRATRSHTLAEATASTARSWPRRAGCWRPRGR